MRPKSRSSFALGFLAALALFTGLAVDQGLAARVTGSSSSQSGEGVSAPPPSSIRQPSPVTQEPPSRRPPASLRRPSAPADPVPQADSPVSGYQATDSGQEPGSPVGTEVRDEPRPARKAKKSSGIRLDFKDAGLDVVAQLISELSGKNFILDPSLKGKTVTIISPKPVTAAEAYKVFESILEIHGLTTIAAGKVIKIVPAADARGRSVETRLEPKKGAMEDKVVTQVIPLRYASSAEVAKVFQQLVSKSAVILSYAPTNTVIVTDYLSNIQRLLRILKVIDVAGAGQEISIVPLKHASSADMVKILAAFFTQKRVPAGVASAEDIRIVPDERTNSLVIMASEVDTKTVKEVVSMLDKPVPKGKGKIHIYPLQNHSAEDVAKVLEKLVSASAKPADPAKKSGETPLLSQNVQISPDKATNSLVIMAQPEDYPVLEAVIRKLDITRPMVYIEALIMEVSTRKNFDLGVEWRIGDDFTIEGGKGVAFGGSGGAGTGGNYSIFPSPTVTTAGVATAFPSAFSFGVLGEAIKVGDVVFPTIGAVVRAYQNDSDVHILSAPQVLTTNNEEAKMTVGKNVPYVTRKETSTSSVDYSTYEYKDVGVTLKITPQISQARTVRLKVFQEVSRLIETGDVDRPTTFKRSTETTVVVKDGQTIVIGGLIDRSTEGTTYRVPCLADIPVIGKAFRSTSETKERTNLYVFLTPHIIEQPGEAKGITEEKKEEMDRIEEEAVKLFGRTGGDLTEALEGMTLDGPAEAASPTPTGVGPGARQSDESEADQRDERVSGTVHLKSRPSSDPSSMSGYQDSQSSGSSEPSGGSGAPAYGGGSSGYGGSGSFPVQPPPGSSAAQGYQRGGQ